MGTYLNPGNENFKEITGMDIYVDKSMLLKSQTECLEDVIRHKGGPLAVDSL